MPGNRRTIRLKDYDYSQEGMYYVTVCVNERKCILGDVCDNKIILNNTGTMITDNWKKLPEHFSNIEIDEFIMMPNHLHGIIAIVGAGLPRPLLSLGRGHHVPTAAATLGKIMAYFKYVTTKQINIIRNTPGIRLWQRNYYEHIIRDESSLNRIRSYIINNPAGWENDEYYCI